MDDWPEFVRAVRCEDLPPCEGLDTEICEVTDDDLTVLVGRLGNGEVVAFAATCPHETTDLRNATFVDGRVRCPRHNYLYDPHTGENLVPARISRPESMWKLRPGYLPTYPVEEHDGWVWVSMSPWPPPASWDPAREVRPAGAVAGVVSPAAEVAVATGPLIVPPVRLRVPVGDLFELSLEMGTAPAHMWTVEAPGQVVAVVEQRLDGGPPACQRVRLTGRVPGEASVRCTFGRPWDPEPAEIRTYVIEVVPAPTAGGER